MPDLAIRGCKLFAAYQGGWSFEPEIKRITRIPSEAVLFLTARRVSTIFLSRRLGTPRRSFVDPSGTGATGQTPARIELGGRKESHAPGKALAEGLHWLKCQGTSAG